MTPQECWLADIDAIEKKMAPLPRAPVPKKRAIAVEAKDGKRKKSEAAQSDVPVEEAVDDVVTADNDSVPMDTDVTH